jgi:protein phosphatase
MSDDVISIAGEVDGMRWGAATDAGRVRTNNEDAFLAQNNVWAVADGMGGHQAGEIASAMAVSTLRERLGSGVSNVDVAIAAVVEANASIFHGAYSNAEQRGMGTTLVALVVINPTDAGGTTERRLALLNVGDSRAYLWRAGVLHRASIDHSYVQELVSTGHISEAEARHHPRRNIVTRALGIEPTVRVDTWTFPLVRGDRFVMCSDGLVDEVDDADIQSVVAQFTDPHTCAERLVAMANESGGRDNVTVVVLDVLEGSQPTDDLRNTTELQVVPQWGEPADDLPSPGLIDADPEPHQVGQVSSHGGDEFGNLADGSPVAPRTLASRAATQPVTFDSAAAEQPARGLSPRKLVAVLAAAGLLTLGITLLAVSLSTNDPPTPATTTLDTIADSIPSSEPSTSVAGTPPSTARPTTTRATATTKPATSTSVRSTTSAAASSISEP